MDADATRNQADRRRSSRRGTKVTLDELVAKSHTMFDRFVPMLGRAAAKIRARLTGK